MRRQPVRTVMLVSLLVAAAVFGSVAGSAMGAKLTGASWIDSFLSGIGLGFTSGPVSPPPAAVPAAVPGNMATRPTAAPLSITQILQMILNPTTTVDFPSDTATATTSIAVPAPGGGCKNNGECPHNSICVAGSCQAAVNGGPCENNADCPKGSTCQFSSTPSSTTVTPALNADCKPGPDGKLQPKCDIQSRLSPMNGLYAAALPIGAGPAVPGAPSGFNGTLQQVTETAAPIMGGTPTGICVDNGISCAVACMFNATFSLTNILGGNPIPLPPGCSCGGGSSSSSSSVRPCGNGQQDVGEECDDGNTIDGDDCSADCKCEICEKCQESEQQMNGGEQEAAPNAGPAKTPISLLYRMISELLSTGGGLAAQTTVSDDTLGVCCRLAADAFTCSREYTKGKCDEEAKNYKKDQYPTFKFTFNFYPVNLSGTRDWWKCGPWKPRKYPTEKDWADAKKDCETKCDLSHPLCNAFSGRLRMEGSISLKKKSMPSGNPLVGNNNDFVADDLKKFLEWKNAPPNEMPQPRFTVTDENQCKPKKICCHIGTGMCTSEDQPASGTACPTDKGFASTVYEYGRDGYNTCATQCRQKNTASKQGILCDRNNGRVYPSKGPPTCSVADLAKKPDGSIDYDYYNSRDWQIFPIDPNPSTGTTNQQQLMAMCKDYCAKDVTCITAGRLSSLTGLHDRPVCSTYYGTATVNTYAGYCNGGLPNSPALSPALYDRWQDCYDAAAKYQYCVTEYDLGPGYGVQPRCETIYDAQKTLDIGKCKGGTTYSTLSECLEAANPTPPPPPPGKKYICCKNTDPTTYPTCDDCAAGGTEYDPTKAGDRDAKVAACRRACPAQLNAVCTNQHTPACTGGTCRAATADGRTYKCLTCTPSGASCSSYTDCCSQRQDMACDYMWHTCTPARGAPCTRDGVGCPPGYRCGLTLRCE